MKSSRTVFVTCAVVVVFGIVWFSTSWLISRRTVHFTEKNLTLAKYESEVREKHSLMPKLPLGASRIGYFIQPNYGRCEVMFSISEVDLKKWEFLNDFELLEFDQPIDLAWYLPNDNMHLVNVRIIDGWNGKPKKPDLRQWEVWFDRNNSRLFLRKHGR